MAEPYVITGWVNFAYGAGGLQYGGTYNREAGDLQVAAYKWNDADTAVTITDTADAAWTGLAQRHHTASGSNLRAQVHLGENLPFGSNVDVFSTPAANVADRALCVAQIRGLAADPMVNSDNVTYHNSVSGTLSAASGDPGGTGIVVGILFVTEDDRTIAPAAGWTALPLMGGSQSPNWVHMIYKITDSAETPQWTVSGGTVVAMSVTLALEAAEGGGGGGGGGGGDTYVNAFLMPSARGLTDLVVDVWSGEPHEGPSVRYTGIEAQDAIDPQGKPAALIQMSPAPAGKSDGDPVIVAAEHPATGKVSSWRVPGKVVGTPVNPSEALAVNDSRRMYIITPQLATTAQVSNAFVQIQTWGPNPALSSVNDGAGDLYNGEVRLKRVTDPINGGSRKAFLHAIAPYFPAYQSSTYRSEITPEGHQAGVVPRPGDRFWGFFGICPDAAAHETGGILAFDLRAGSPSNNGGPSPLAVTIGGGRASIARSWNASYNGASPPGREVYDTSISTDGWTLFFFHIGLHYNNAQGPFLRLWKKVGAGPILSVINVNGPIGYNDPNPNVYPTFGASRLDPWPSPSTPKCVVHHKGVQLFRDEPPGSGEPELSVQSLLATAEAAFDDAPSYSRMVNEMDSPSEGRGVRWVSWSNNPNNVAFVGGPGGKPCPAVIAAGALPRGTTVASGIGVPPQYLGPGPWPLYSPWIVALEEADLATGTTRLHTETNCAIQFERTILCVYRNSLSAWQTIRDRTDMHTLFLADEEYLLAEYAHTAVQTRAPGPGEGAGIIMRVPAGSGDAIHCTFVKGPIGFPLSVWGNGIDLSSIVTDIRCLAVAYRLRAVPWDPNGSFTPANVRLVIHVGSDSRVVDPHPWGMPPHVLTCQRRVLTTWDWYTGITLRDTIRSDRQDAGSPSAEAGFTKSQALANPIPGWAA
jgi:hypothetical protein